MARRIVFFFLSLLFLVACENDLNSVDARFIDNKDFETLEDYYEVSIATVDIEKVETTALESVKNAQGGVPDRYLLGVYGNSDLGTIKASFVSQLKLPTDVLLYDNVVEPDTLLISSMDGVVLYIPYESSLRTTDADTKGKYVLDSVFGVYNETTEIYDGFDIEVYELETFLSDLDPLMPSQRNTFYTNDTYIEGELIGSVTDFMPSHLDTVSFIERKIDGVSYYKDSIFLNTDASPRMVIPLNANYFKGKILDKLNKNGDSKADVFATQNDFIRYFKGLYVKAISNDPASMASLRLSNAYVGVYYTNLIKSISQNKNLDTIRETKTFLLGDLKASVHERVASRKNEDGKVYVQGATGSEGSITLFPNAADLTNLRANINEKGAIINEASIKIFVDDASPETVQRLFIYKITSEGSLQVEDYITASNTSGAQGFLQQEEEADGGRYFYEFKITDYIKELVKEGNTDAPDELRIKVYMSGDLPTTVSDNLISSNNWDPRGVVLSTSDIDLKVNYSKIK